jgi:hypothetical protein
MQEARGSSPLISTIISRDYERLAIERLPASFLFGVFVVKFFFKRQIVERLGKYFSQSLVYSDCQKFFPIDP